MNVKTLKKAREEAKKFLELADRLIVESENVEYWLYTSTVLRGSVKRQSMELTRSLANLRKTTTE